MNSRIRIGFATVQDEPRIIEFLRDHWQSNHVFVTNPEVLCWQHQSPDAPGDSLTYVLASCVRGDGVDDVVALLGFIPFRRFDPDAAWTELALAIWKVKEGAGAPGLGLYLLSRIQRDLKPDMIVAIGISPTVKPIYQTLGYEVSTLSHWALFGGFGAKEPSVAVGVPREAMRSISVVAGIELIAIVGECLPSGIKVEDIDALGRAAIPGKSWAYLINRFVRHPWYDYELRVVVLNGQIRAVLVWRRVTCQSGLILRIVDIVGDGNVLASCGGHLQSEVVEAGAEYIDLMHWGLSPEALRDGGFVSPYDHSNLVLPSRFAPFEQCSTPIEIAFKVAASRNGQRLQLFRADSDQDRPNQPSELGGKCGND